MGQRGQPECHGSRDPESHSYLSFLETKVSQSVNVKEVPDELAGMGQ